MIYRAVRPLVITYFSTNSLYYLLIPCKALPSLSQIMRWGKRRLRGKQRNHLRGHEGAGGHLQRSQRERWRHRRRKAKKRRRTGTGVCCWPLGVGAWKMMVSTKSTEIERRHFTEIMKLKWGHRGEGGSTQYNQCRQGMKSGHQARNRGKTTWRQRGHHLQAKETSLTKNWFCQYLHLRHPHLQKEQRIHFCCMTTACCTWIPQP